MSTIITLSAIVNVLDYLRTVSLLSALGRDNSIEDINIQVTPIYSIYEHSGEDRDLFFVYKLSTGWNTITSSTLRYGITIDPEITMMIYYSANRRRIYCCGITDTKVTGNSSETKKKVPPL